MFYDGTYHRKHARVRRVFDAEAAQCYVGNLVPGLPAWILNNTKLRTMKTALLATLLGSAAAFAPAQTGSASTSLSAFADGMVGGEGPEPMPGFRGSSVEFDPCGFAERAPEWLPWFREAELKHGRAAMLATVGFVVPEMVRIPGEQFSFESILNVIEAHDKLPDSMQQIFLWISLLEAMTIPAYAGFALGYDRRPGDFSFDPLGFYPTDPEKQREMQLKELKNGRLAMIAIGGMVTGATITGHGFPYV